MKSLLVGSIDNFDKRTTNFVVRRQDANYFSDHLLRTVWTQSKLRLNLGVIWGIFGSMRSSDRFQGCIWKWNIVYCMRDVSYQLETFYVRIRNYETTLGPKSCYHVELVPRERVCLGICTMVPIHLWGSKQEDLLLVQHSWHTYYAVEMSQALKFKRYGHH